MDLGSSGDTTMSQETRVGVHYLSTAASMRIDPDLPSCWPGEDLDSETEEKEAEAPKNAFYSSVQSPAANSDSSRARLKFQTLSIEIESSAASNPAQEPHIGSASLSSPTKTHPIGVPFLTTLQEVPEPRLRKILSGNLHGLEENLNDITHLAVQDVPITQELGKSATEIDKCVQRRHKYMVDERTAKERDLKAEQRLPPSDKPPYLPYESSVFSAAEERPVKAPFPEKLDRELKFENGVYAVQGANGEWLESPVSCTEFYDDLRRTMKVVLHPPTKDFCHKRLKLIETKFKMYLLLNEDKEVAITRINPHRDFYNVRKVDTHIHHSASMHQKHLLRFIKKKLKTDKDEIVIHRDGKDMTLAEVFDSLQVGGIR
jgi:hypothetical protein